MKSPDLRSSLLGLLLAATAASAQIRTITPAQIKSSQVLSPAVEADGYVYISGQGPTRSDGTMPADFWEQCRQVLDNVTSILRATGLGLENVVYTQVYLEDVGKYEAMNRIFGQYFGKFLPARAVLGVAKLPAPAIQISAIAVRDLTGKRVVQPADFDWHEAAAPGVLTRDRMFISGMVGSDLRTGKVPADPGTQVDFALDRMQAVLKAAGLDLGNMVFVNPYLTLEIPARVMNDHYARRFEFGNTPARATIEVASLPAGSHIEYTGVAVRDLKQRQAVRPKNMAPSPTASPCVFAGDTLFCSAKSGFIPGPHGGEYATTTPHQLRQTMRNLLDNLEEAGMKFDQVVSTCVYLDNLSDTAAFDQVYVQYFGPVMPARTTIQQIAPAERKADAEDHFPDLEQVSLIAVRDHGH